MAGSWYHASVKSIGRSSGRSAVAAAAYRAGCRLHDERTGLDHDYTRKGGVEWSAVLLPDHAPAAFADPARLWNAAEKAEKRKNSVTARELELALPGMLPEAERRRIAEDVARFLVERYGVAAHVAVHRPHRDGDQRNHHAHILFTTRRLDRDGLTEKTRELDDNRDRGPKEIEAIREAAAAIINRELERAGLPERVDHRSHERRGIDREPSQHLGPAASTMERRGTVTRIGDFNRTAANRNRQRDEQRREAEVFDLAIERLRQTHRHFADRKEQRRAAHEREIAEVEAFWKEQRKARFRDKEKRITAAVTAQHRRFWTSLFQRQEQEREQLQHSQREPLSRLAVWLKDRRAGRLAEPERKMLSGALRALTGKDEALKRMQERHKAERAELRGKIMERIRPAIDEIEAEFKAELAQLREAERIEIKQRQELEQHRKAGFVRRPAPQPQPEPEPEKEEKATGTDGLSAYDHMTARRAAFERARAGVSPAPQPEEEKATGTDGLSAYDRMTARRAAFERARAADMDFDPEPER